jgi:WD40 repeat protein
MKRGSTKPFSPPPPSITIAAEPFRISARSDALALRADDREVATCDGATVRVNDARSGQLLRRGALAGFDAHPENVLLACSADNALLFVGATAGIAEQSKPVLVLDANTLAVTKVIEPEFDATAIAGHPSDPSLVLVAGTHLAMYDARAGRIFAELAASGAGRHARRALFSPSGQWLAIKTDSSVELWSVATLERTKTYPLATWSAAIAFSSDSERLVVCTQGRLVSLSVASDERPFERPFAANVGASDNRPTELFELDDDEMLLCLGADLRVFDARTLELRRSASDRCHIGDRVLSRDRKVLFANNAEGAIERVELDRSR